MSTIPSPYVRKALRIDPDDKERLILEYAPTIKYIAQRIAAHGCRPISGWTTSSTLA